MAQSTSEHCYHCGLPCLDDKKYVAGILQKKRQFCCQGCLSVAQAIDQAGLADYYLHRQGVSASQQSTEELNRQLEELGLYDTQTIQQSFVVAKGDKRTAQLILEKIHCPACLWLNENHMRKQPGVIEIQIDYTTEQMILTWDDTCTSLSKLLEAIRSIGYQAYPFDPHQRECLLEDQRRRSTERLVFSGAILFMVMHFAMASYILNPPEPFPLWLIIGRWSALVATLAVIFYPAQDFFIGAWRDLKNRRLGMDIPIVLGLLLAFGGSLVNTIDQSGEVYFDSVVMFVFFLLLARRFEFIGRRKAAAYLDRLVKVIPQHIARIEDDGSRHQVLVNMLKAGDKISLNAGERLPRDARLVSEKARFDESLLTGESDPVRHYKNDIIAAGAVCYDQGAHFEITQDESFSSIAQTQKLLARGISIKPRLAEMSNKIASYFIPAIISLALINMCYWWWVDAERILETTIALLIVTCPCALALSVPVAITVSAARLIQEGILPLQMRAIEKMDKATVLLMDKTGSLTQAKPSLVRHRRYGKDAMADYALSVMVSASMHPYSRVLAQDYNWQGKNDDVVNYIGDGLRWNHADDVWCFGRPGFVVRKQDNQSVIKDITKARAQGLGISLLSKNNQVLEFFGFQDRLRNDMEELLDSMEDSGITRMEIISGDQQTAVDRLNEPFPKIQFAKGGMKPADKLSYIEKIQQQKHQVIMLGDGINDAPTLAAADVSVSFQSATDLAQAQSDFCLLGQSLKGLVRLRLIAQKTMRIIRQNLGWALIYNALAIPLAMAGLIPPWAAAIGMSVSSLAVVLNSLRLQKR